jgi:hypothetical protein
MWGVSQKMLCCRGAPFQHGAIMILLLPPTKQQAPGSPKQANKKEHTYSI